MNYKAAAVRAFRTFLQGVLATFTAFFLAVKDDGTFLSISAHGEVLLFGLFLSFCAALISFIQNLLEDRSGLNVPK